MKNKQKAALRLLAALLALTLLAPLGLTASAADGPDTIYIDSASDFVSFAKSCACFWPSPSSAGWWPTCPWASFSLAGSIPLPWPL